MKRIFIGSSTEAVHCAEAVRALLATAPDVEILLWTEIFAPSSLTFEAIEAMARRVDGAVLLASPDDESVIRGNRVSVPRANVMIEFGYLTALLGRRRIALCRYDGVDLATDLKGFTYIGMGEFPADPTQCTLNSSSATQLLQWTRSLPALAPGVPHGNVVHGYTGRWKVQNSFDWWRSLNLGTDRHVDFDGYLDLFMPGQGNNGYGVTHGILYVQMPGCYAQVHFSAEVANAYTEADGSLHFTSRMQSRRSRIWTVSRHSVRVSRT